MFPGIWCSLILYLNKHPQHKEEGTAPEYEDSRW